MRGDIKGDRKRIAYSRSDKNAIQSLRKMETSTQDRWGGESSREEENETGRRSDRTRDKRPEPCDAEEVGWVVGGDGRSQNQKQREGKEKRDQENSRIRKKAVGNGIMGNATRGEQEDRETRREKSELRTNAITQRETKGRGGNAF